MTVKELIERFKLGVLQGEVAYVASKNLGYGEEGGDNRGPFIRDIGGTEGEEWCAAFAGYCYEHAFEMLNTAGMEVGELPFKRSLGAKRLTKNLGAVGSLYTDPLKAVTGDLVCFHRRLGIIDWRGHVGVIKTVGEGQDGKLYVHTIEGNALPYPSPVSEFTYQVDKDGTWWRVGAANERTKVRFYRLATLRKGIS